MPKRNSEMCPTCFICVWYFESNVATLGFFKEWEWVAIISVKKVIIGWISGLKGDKKWPKICQWMIYAVTII